MFAPARLARVAGIALASGCCAACTGPQSSLDPAGLQAEVIASLFWWMLAGATLVWSVSISLTVHAVWVRRTPMRVESARRLVVVGGFIVPAILLAFLLARGLAMLPPLVAEAPEGTRRIEVSGEQFWWRVRYLDAAGVADVELANEVRLPVGRPVEFLLESPDVIHSFWIPVLGGKMDMIPGRRTRLVLEPRREGVYRGVCAEYCGASHAHMAFDVVVSSVSEFDRWMEGQRRPAAAADHPGAEAFLRNGCGACHTIRGTPASGIIGPDLTHVGSRHSVGAGRMPNEREALRSWLVAPELHKPGALMPAFGMLGDDELDLLAGYLEALK